MQKRSLDGLPTEAGPSLRPLAEERSTLTACRLVPFILTALVATRPALGGFLGVQLRTGPGLDVTATLLIGQEAHVVRFYAVFDGNDPQNAVLAVFDTDLQLIDPQAFFHQFPPPEGADTPPDGDLFPGFPTLRWDTYVGIGNLDYFAAPCRQKPFKR